MQAQMIMSFVFNICLFKFGKIDIKDRSLRIVTCDAASLSDLAVRHEGMSRLSHFQRAFEANNHSIGSKRPNRISPHD
jgi:hypothetical protein